MVVLLCFLIEAGEGGGGTVLDEHLGRVGSLTLENLSDRFSRLC